MAFVLLYSNKTGLNSHNFSFEYPRKAVYNTINNYYFEAVEGVNSIGVSSSSVNLELRIKDLFFLFVQAAVMVLVATIQHIVPTNK